MWKLFPLNDSRGFLFQKKSFELLLNLSKFKELKKYFSILDVWFGYFKSCMIFVVFNIYVYYEKNSVGMSP
jgi:hypothetical protein